jgi:hypothetical protein
MPIRINCRHCGKRFSAWDDLVGKPVKCPKCQQEMIVPGGDAEFPASPPAAADDFPTMTAPPTVAPNQPTPAAPAPRKIAPPPAAATASSSPPANRPTPQPVDDFDDSEELPFACPNCHQPMPQQEDLCDHCGYHRVLKRRIDISSGVHKPDKSTGFERVFRGQLEDADSATGTLTFMKVGGALFTLAFVFVCFPWSLLIVIGGAVGFVIYRQRQPKQAAETQDSAVNRDFLSETIWSIVLNCQRALGWRVPKWPFPKTRALTLHDSTFTDEDLAAFDNLAEYQTLDLQGTQISNEGLQQLDNMKHIQFLVVRATNVTGGGVQRLQQALPKAWIWY